MLINKKLIATIGLLSTVAFIGLTSMQQQEDMKAQNLKVLPKGISNRQLDGVMEEWSHSLGVRCNFCHVHDDATNKMNWASDAKPEKKMARMMYKMEASLNKKYFGSKKDSLGLMMETGVNCYTCHNGKAHPEVQTPPAPPRRPGPPPGAQPNGTPPPQGTPPTGR